ncbi:MAG: GDSL-type esterase/lipase family protein [Chloroflexaceae bacterium]|nr:GDSL-type esterase/lipase family protein [Chloroflexaceae bacterium]
MRTYIPLVLLFGMLLTLIPAPPPVRATPPTPQGLHITRQDDGQLLLESPGRFALTFDEQGIAAWHDLRRDPQRARNLVQAGKPLLEHRSAEGALLQGNLSLEDANPVRARLRWDGTVATSGQPFTTRYNVWVGGQIAVETASDEPIHTTLQRDPNATTGAALQALPGTDSRQRYKLFLDAWTGEDSGSLAVQHEDGASVAAALTPALQASGPAALELHLPPEAGLRQPAFSIASWPGSELTVQRGRRVLLPGHDYLAHWDESTGELTVQYLHLLPASATAAEHAFTLTNTPPPPVLALGIVGRTLDEDGLLLVDANMPDNSGALSLLDTFRIPYIQSSPRLTVEAALNDGAGVEYVLSTGATARSFSPPHRADFTLPTPGNYRLDAYILNTDGSRRSSTPDDSIPVLSYGLVLLALGDSITAGAEGDAVRQGDPNYPVDRASRSPHSSADGRNFYQYDNRNLYGTANAAFLRSYQPRLNDLLTTCSQLPVFILNDGYGGLRTARQEPLAPPGTGTNFNNAYTKRAAYNDHIAKLGVGHVLLQLGTNDANDAVVWSSINPDPSITDPNRWAGDLKLLLDALQTANPGLSMWLARIPWQSDSAANAAQTARYNAVIPGIVEAENIAENPVYLGPAFYELFQTDPTLLAADGFHPNQNGYERMADLWAETLCARAPSLLPPVVYPVYLPVVTR